MANQDHFIVRLRGQGYLQYPIVVPDFEQLLRQTQLDFSHYEFHVPQDQGGTGDPSGNRVWFDVTADDVFQGNQADVNTVKSQIDAVLSGYLSNYGSAIMASQVIPATVAVATQVNPNTGQVNVSHVPIGNNNGQPQDNRNWFDRTFFTGAGALTGVGIATLVVIGAAVFIKER